MKLTGKAKEAFDILSAANRDAYKDVFLLSNQVLGKNIFNNDFFISYLNNDNPKEPRFFKIIYKLLIYYFKSLMHFIAYLMKFIEYDLSGLRFHFGQNSRELILIDTFFITDKIKEAGEYRDPFFPGLEDLLKKKNKHYAYLPLFYNASSPLKPIGVLNILKKEQVPVLCEYRILSIADILSILRFIVSYPFHVYKFAGRLDKNNYGNRLLAGELMDTIDHVTFYSFSRYLQGKRIAALKYERITLISWFENQTIDKNLYKGLRSYEGKVKIYGAQTLLYSKNMLNVTADDNEKEFGTLPDKIIVSGSFYIPEGSTLNYSLGPSMRYAKVFTDFSGNELRKNILVLLPMMSNDIKNILKILKEIDMSERDMILKAHPATRIEDYMETLPENIKITEENIYELLKKTLIVVSAASGSLIEAASIGIPAIVVKGKDTIDLNPLPEYGKGIIWDEADTPESLLQLINKFTRSLKDNSKEIAVFAAEYKRMFFTEPTEEIAINAFGL